MIGPESITKPNKMDLIDLESIILSLRRECHVEMFIFFFTLISMRTMMMMMMDGMMDRYIETRRGDWFFVVLGNNENKIFVR